jgi:hypothetical protein
MRAVLMTAAGGPDVLELAELPKPEITSDHDVLGKADELQKLQSLKVTLVLFTPGAGQTQHGADSTGVLFGLDADLDVLKSRQSIEHPGGLECPRYPEPVHFVGLATDDVDGMTVLAREHDRAFLRLVDAREAVEQRRLPGPIGSDDRQQLSSPQTEGHVGEARDSAKAKRHVLDAEQSIVRERRS